MKIFVTGATGFIGRAFCAAASARGHEILGMCRQVENVGGHRVVRGSMAEIPWRAIKEFSPDAALHLAWIATPGEYLQSPDNDVLAAQSGALFRGLFENGVAHVAGVGTCIEYAPSVAPLREDAPLSPASPYARAKVAACRSLRALAEDGKQGWSWFRIFYPYGEGEHAGRFPSWLMRKLAGSESPELKTPDSIKDYVHVQDAADAMLRSLEHRLVGPVNIGTGAGARVLDLARLIARVVAVDPDAIRVAKLPVEDPFPVTVADMTRLKMDGWQPLVSLEEGLKRLWASLGRGKIKADCTLPPIV